jgi:hypothetical protein
MQRSHAIASIAALVLSASAAVAEPVAYPAKGQSFDKQNRPRRGRGAGDRLVEAGFQRKERAPWRGHR